MLDCALQFAPNGFSKDGAYKGNLSEVVAYAIEDTVKEFMTKYPNFRSSFTTGGVPDPKMGEYLRSTFEKKLAGRMKARTRASDLVPEIDPRAFETGAFN